MLVVTVSAACTLIFAHPLRSEHHRGWWGRARGRTRGRTLLLQVMLTEGRRLPLQLRSSLKTSSSSAIQESRETFSWSSSKSTHQPEGNGGARAQERPTLVLPNASCLEHGPAPVAASLAALASRVTGTLVLLHLLYPNFLYNMGEFSSETFSWHHMKSKVFQNKEVRHIQIKYSSISKMRN